MRNKETTGRKVVVVRTLQPQAHLGKHLANTTAGPHLLRHIEGFVDHN